MTEIYKQGTEDRKVLLVSGQNIGDFGKENSINIPFGVDFRKSQIDANDKVAMSIFESIDRNKDGVIDENELNDFNNSKIVVQDGESPEDIAKLFGCNLDDLLEINKFNVKKFGKSKGFEVGAEIIIPGVGAEVVNKINSRRKSAKSVVSNFIDDQKLRDAGLVNYDRKGETVSAQCNWDGKTVNVTIIGQCDDGNYVVEGATDEGIPISKMSPEYEILGDNQGFARYYAGEKFDYEIDGKQCKLVELNRERDENASSRDIVEYVDNKGSVFRVRRTRGVYGAGEQDIVPSIYYSTSEKVSLNAISDMRHYDYNSGHSEVSAAVLGPAVGPSGKQYGYQVITEFGELKIIDKDKTRYYTQDEVNQELTLQACESSDIIDYGHTVAMLQSEIDVAKEAFERQINEEGFFAKSADWLSYIWAWAGDDKNQASAVEDDLKILESGLSKMKADLEAGKLDDFKKDFKDIFGVEYNKDSIIEYKRGNSDKYRASAFGTSRIADIITRVQEYNKSQNVGGNVVKALFNIATGMIYPGLGVAFLTGVTVNSIDFIGSKKLLDLIENGNFEQLEAFFFENLKDLGLTSFTFGINIPVPAKLSTISGTSSNLLKRTLNEGVKTTLQSPVGASVEYADSRIDNRDFQICLAFLNSINP